MRKNRNSINIKGTFIYPLLLLLLLAACTGNHRQMQERLQYVSDCNRADTVFTARWLPTVDSLVSYFDRHGSANDRMMAHYVQGRVYHDMGEAPQALECYQRAVEQADTTRTDCDLYTLVAVYGQMANLFNAKYLPDDEMEALQYSEYYSWKDKDTLSALIAYELRTRPYFLRNDTDSILFISRNAYQLFSDYHYVDQSVLSLPLIINICIDRGEYDKAAKTIKIFEGESRQFDKKGNIKKGREIYYYDKGRLALATNKTDSAIFYFNKALSAGYREAGYRGLLSVYEQQGRSDSIAKYAKLFAKANDSCYYHVNQEKVHQIGAMYNYSRQQRIAEENKAKAARMKSYLLIFALIFTMVIALIAFFNHKVHTRNRLRISQLLNDKADIQALLSEKQGQLEVITATKETEIERITQESNQMLIDALRDNQQLQRQIAELDRELATISRSDFEKAFSKSTIAQYFQTIRDERPRKAPPTDLEWQQFTKTFQNYFTAYYSFVTNGRSLSKDQLRVCMMLRLNFQESEMAFFMDTDKQRIDRVKTQVNNKLFKTSNSSSLRERLKQHF